MADVPSLASYLRALRTRASPDGLGITATAARRRVPGLRREEVAHLAGLSMSYYTSLEQGRAVHASPEVLGSIARAMDLDEVEEGHLHALAGGLRRRSPGRRRPERAPAPLVALLAAMGDVPAFVHGPALDVLAWNPLGHALYAPHVDRDAAAHRSGRPNLARMVFLDPRCRELYVDWWAKASSLVALLRLNTGRDPRDAGLSGLVAELVADSADFAGLWARHDVEACTVTTLDLDHPLVGRVTVTQQALASVAAPGEFLVAATAQEGSLSSERLRTLSGLASAGLPVAGSGSEVAC